MLTGDLMGPGTLRSKMPRLVVIASVAWALMIHQVRWDSGAACEGVLDGDCGSSFVAPASLAVDCMRLQAA
jgi:hypothetical protein